MSVCLIFLALGWTTSVKQDYMLNYMNSSIFKQILYVLPFAFIALAHFGMGCLMVLDHEEDHKFHEY